MKYISLIAVAVFLLGCNQKKNSTKTENFISIDQDYELALKTASKENKLLFIDFYTTWCAPCKEVDELVFQNDSIQQILKKDYVFLRYNAENDTVFHLSKKHHVSSYPTGLVLNSNGYVVNRKYGFPGDDFKSLSKSVLEFTTQSKELSKQAKFLDGYSNSISISKYPKFYIDYINRTNTKINPSELNAYWAKEQDVFSEEYFSTLIYFAREASNTISNTTLQNKKKYVALFGKTDVDILFYFLTSGKFNTAILEKDQLKYDEAIVFAKEALSKSWTDDILPSFEIDFLKAQNKWRTVFEINHQLKKEGKFSSGEINYFCWDVYQNCDDMEVVKKCLSWMQEVISEEPSYAFLDTYAFLMYKSGDKNETKKIVEVAIEAAIKENKKTEDLKKLLNKL
ncbi:hypothetical protein GCM10011416_20920 [Polaribacter pacificus]|uniref:Thioredoxin domain-containing protein n=1 Tax=Polaribacter pacificus TaxID=1775173 RepID=A0A917MEZ0_9FLAO|nr:thioredoxin family protein [Polaribacter pacificus]GGH01942.1 hypothetical protein GCM10011416_20920 [Polaribacter pacificus]